MAIKLHLIDEVNIYFEGLPKKDARYVVEKTKKSVKGAFQTADFKLGKWDGKESQFTEEGYGFAYMLDKILDILEQDLLYNIDEFELVDHRMSDPIPEDIEPIDNTYLSNMGITLHDHQVDSVNTTIEKRKGIINVATSGGKSAICVALSKKFGPYIPSIVVVPSAQLLNQTYEDYAKEGTMDVVKITKDDSAKKRLEKIANHRHIIITYKLLGNLKEQFESIQAVVIQDETHICGDIMFGIWRDELADCPVRVGMTASVPKDGQKKEKIMCHIGGDILNTTKTHELQDLGIISGCHIDVYYTHDNNVPDFESWDDEKKYLNKNKKRIQAIADFLDGLPETNTLILAHPQLGAQLAEKLNCGFVDKDAKTEYREELFNQFENHDEIRHVATFGTSSTGISINRIFRLVMIDIGKNTTAITQSLGRSLRKDGVIDHAAIIDIYANMKYSNRHKATRMGQYKSSKQQFAEHNSPIPVL